MSRSFFFFLENSLCLIFYKPAATSHQHPLITSQPLSGSFRRKLDNDLSLVSNFWEGSGVPNIIVYWRKFLVKTRIRLLQQAWHCFFLFCNNAEFNVIPKYLFFFFLCNIFKFWFVRRLMFSFWNHLWCWVF